MIFNFQGVAFFFILAYAVGRTHHFLIVDNTCTSHKVEH